MKIYKLFFSQKNTEKLRAIKYENLENLKTTNFKPNFVTGFFLKKIPSKIITTEMLYDGDRNRAGFESKKKKSQILVYTARNLLSPFCILLLIGSLLFGVSSYVLTGDIIGKEKSQTRLVTRSLRDIPEITVLPVSSNETTTEVTTTEKSTTEKSTTEKSTTLSTTTTERVKTCDGPRKNIFFLKTHKAGSTTVQNVLLRYGERNNATFALPKQSAAHVFNYNVKFSNSMVRPSPSGEYNILCNHLHFYEPGVRQVMPKDTKFIAIVRHPIDLFESIMSYYSDDVRAFQRVPGNDIKSRMKNFLDHPLKYYGYDSSHYERFARNAMMWDFGFDNDEDDDHKIDQWIKYLDDTFDLVLITDYFDESMVLLKEELCWSTDDISYLKSNSRQRSQESVREWLGEEYSQKLLNWNKADWKLYQHFNQTFTKKVEAFGVERMKREVEKLQTENGRIRDQCLSGDQTTTFFRQVPLTKYKLKDKNDDFCQNLIRSERQYLYKINTNQERMMNEQKM